MLDTGVSRDNPIPVEGARLVRATGLANEPLLREIGELRLRVWQESGTKVNLPPGSTEWRDERLDPAGSHVAVLLDGKVIAATRLNIYENWEALRSLSSWFDGVTEPPEGRFGVIQRLVVAPEHQHCGLGKFLDRELLQEARKRHCDSVVCDVPPYRVEPLQRMGFRVIAPPKHGQTLPEVAWTMMRIDL